ncbi:MAG TPA: MBL fold metallo-hydrolase [Dehalococcoidia bacterium]|nr:MBL fold metallo-hydrolase [Dehalococcoidia bacterium]
MEISWLGHSCFRLRSNEVVVVTDPFPESLGLKPDTRPATVVTVSNAHSNHSHWEGISGDPRVFSAPGEYEFAGISVRGVMTPLSEGMAQGQRNVAYSMELEGINLCHLGDITEPLTPRHINELSPVDVLLLPTGGGCTLAVDRILQTMRDLDPKIVIPMHYRIPNVSVELENVDVFLRLMGSGETQTQPRLTVTASNLPQDLRVSVLAPQARAA